MLIKRLGLLLILILGSIKATAFAFPEQILFKGYAQQFVYRHELLYEGSKGKSDTQIVEIFRELEKWAEQKDELELKCGFQVSVLSISLEKRVGDTSANEKKLIALITTLENEGLVELKAEAVQALASYYWSKERYAEAFEKHINAYGIYNKFTLQQFPGKPEFLKDFGGRYFHYRDYATSAHYIKQGYLTNPDQQEGYIYTLLNTLSLCYLYTERLDSAEYYMNKVYSLAQKHNDSTWIGIISGNMGMLNYMLNKPDDALRWFQQEIESFDNKRSLNIANTYAIEADIYISKGEKEKALQLALEAYDILRGSENYIRNFRVSNMIFSGLAKAYAANGDMESAYLYLDSARVAKDSLNKKTSAHVLTGVAHTMAASQRLMEQEKYEQQSQNYKMLRNILVGAIVLIVIIAILIYNRQRLKHKFSQKQLEAEKQHVQSELGIATKQLDSLVGSISEKNDLIETFTAELNSLREHVSADKLNKADETLMHLQKATVITDEEWEHFVHMFDKVHKGFTKRLNDKIKGLSPIEVKFIMLSKMKLTTKDIASALGISPESVRLNRKRLYVKLGLEENEYSLKTFIDSI